MATKHSNRLKLVTWLPKFNEKPFYASWLWLLGWGKSCYETRIDFKTSQNFKSFQFNFNIIIIIICSSVEAKKKKILRNLFVNVVSTNLYRLHLSNQKNV